MRVLFSALVERDLAALLEDEHEDHRVWQDVYRPTTHAGVVYLKLTVIDDMLIVSFKEL